VPSNIERLYDALRKISIEANGVGRYPVDYVQRIRECVVPGSNTLARQGHGCYEDIFNKGYLN